MTLPLFAYANIIIGRSQYHKAGRGRILARRDIVAAVEDEDLVLVAEAAQQTGYSAEWLRKLIDAGKVRGKRVGRFYVMPMSEVSRLKRQPRSGRGRPRKPADPA
jgi:excisionase family DNA binding protein